MTLYSLPRAWIHGLGIGVIGLCALSGYLLVVQPILSAERESEWLASSAESLKAEAASYDLARARWERKHEQYTAESQRIAIKLEPIDKLNEHLNEITKLAESLGLTLSRVDPGQASTLRGKVRVVFGFAGHGPFTRLVEMLRVVHAQYPDCRVSGLKLSGLAGAERTQFTLDLVWFALPSAGPETQSPMSGHDGSSASAGPVEEPR
jgi:hypothetical protein